MLCEADLAIMPSWTELGFYLIGLEALLAATKDDPSENQTRSGREEQKEAFPRLCGTYGNRHMQEHQRWRWGRRHEEWRAQRVVRKGGDQEYPEIHADIKSHSYFEQNGNYAMFTNE